MQNKTEPPRLAVVAARGSIATFIGQGVRILAQFASLVVLSRLLPPEAFGLVAVCAAIVAVGEILRDLGTSSAAIQAPTITDGQKTNLFWLNVCCGLILAAVVCMLSQTIAELYGDRRITPLLIFLSLTFVLNGFSSQFNADLARHMRFQRLAAIDAVAQLVSSLAAITVAVLTHSLWALVVQQVGAALLVLLQAVAASGWRPHWPSRVDSIASLVRFGGWLSGTTLLGTVTDNIDKIALGSRVSPTQVGLYSRAFQLSIAPMSVLAIPLTRVAVPVLSRLQADIPRFVAAALRGQVYSAYVTTAAFLFLAGSSRSVVQLVLGETWVAAAPVLSALAVGCMFRVFNQIVNWTYVGLGRTRDQFHMYLVTQPVIWILIVAGTHWGIVGAALGQLFGYFLGWVVAVIWVTRVIRQPARLFFTNTARAAVAIGVPIFVVARTADLHFRSPIIAILTGALGSAIWVLTCCAIFKTVRSDLLSIWRLARSARQVA